MLEAGDPGLVAFLRSSAKPLQALPRRPRARPTSTTRRSRSPALRTSPARSSSPRSAACSRERRRDERRARVRPGADAGRAQLLRQARRLARPLPRAAAGRRQGYRLAGHPRAGGAACAESQRPPASTRRRSRRGRRLRRPHLRAPARAHGAGVRPAPAARGRRARRAARCSAHPDHIRGPLAADSLLMRHCAGLDGQGRRRGAALRRRPGRPRSRAQGRGRRAARRSARRSRGALAGSARTSGELAPVARREQPRRGVGELRVRIVKKCFHLS